MSAADLKAIRERVAAASNGPWRQEYGWNNGGMATGYFYIPEHNGGAKVEMLADDTAFIAHAREDVPALLADVDRLTALLREARGHMPEREPFGGGLMTRGRDQQRICRVCRKVIGAEDYTTTSHNDGCLVARIDAELAP